MRTLRPYQIEAVKAIEEHWGEWQRELLVCCTGGGKTVIFNEIAKRHAPGVLIVCGRDELIEQARDKYDGETGKIKAAENVIKDVTVGSIQTMSRRTYDPNLFSTIIVDEAHHAISDSYQKLLQQFPNAKVLGVTASPDRGDKKSLAKYFDGIAYEYSLKRGIQEGYLSPLVARTIPLNIDLSQVKVSVGDFEVNSIAETLEPYLPQIADSIKEYASDRKTIVFMPLVHIAQEFTAILRSKGIDAREVNGASPDRKEKLEWIDKAPKGSVIVNSMLLTEGFDCPSLDCLVVLRPTKVRSLYCQMAGRITRTYPGKENGLILDFLWQTMKYNLCRPASLGTDNEEDIKRVVRKTTEEQLDLFDAITDAEEARKNALAEALRKQTKKKAKLVDPLTLFDILDDIGLADYEPTFEWEEADASQKQIECLEKFGIDAEGITKGYACKIMDACISRSRNKMATIKQVRTLKKFGYNDSPKWSFEKANKKISQLAAVNWQRWKLRD